MRTRHRSGSRQSAGRPPTSPIAPAHLSERPTCIIGADRASVGELADTLEEFAAAQVDRLDLNRRSLDLVSRRDYGLVVIVVGRADSVAFVNELTRRLARTRRRECAVLVCHEPGGMSPAVEQLLVQTGAASVLRPLDTAAFMASVQRATDGALVTAAS